jgi:hypothetical protein
VQVLERLEELAAVDGAGADFRTAGSFVYRSARVLLQR